MPDVTEVKATALLPHGSRRVALRDVIDTVQVIKAGKTIITGIEIVNDTAGTVFVQVFNKAAASVVLGVDTPYLEYQLALNTSLYPPFPLTGITFPAAASVASTTLEGGSVSPGTGVQVSVQIV